MSRLVRSFVALASLLLLSGLAVTSVPAPASATSTILCTGYTGCGQQNMWNGGYRAQSGTMWWLMYSGHNCTNYAAYRMVKSGLPNVRPWSGGGNATFWGTQNPEITDDVPMVGAVAWWKANVRPAGSAGHVAYVEKVISADEIIVSQDSWGGDFSWARITRAGGSWPSGFVHFNDKPLTNAAPPVITGTAKVGSKLTASGGRWSPAAVTISYQWRANGVAIPGATGSTITLKLAQQGKRISVRTSAAKLGYPTAVATSATTTSVAPGQITNSVAPVITGQAKVDSTLTASTGSWTPTPTGLAYQWAADGTAIDGATKSTLIVGPSLVDKRITVRVTASKDGYKDVTTASAPTAVVLPGTFTMTGEPTLTGTPLLGETLTADPGSFAPATGKVEIQWVRAGRAIPGATGPTYVLTKDDLGSHVRARVTVTRPGYTSYAARTPATWLVKSPATLRIAPHADTGKVSFDLTVTARGVDAVEGTVVVKADGKVLKSATLRGGTARVTFTGLPRGHLTLEFRYLGSDLATPTATISRTVWIK